MARKAKGKPVQPESVVEPDPIAEPAPPPEPTSDEEYSSTLVDGLTPSPIEWNGRLWRTNMGSAWNLGMEHCLRLSSTRARFELRDTVNDRSTNDDPSKRRTEISGSLYGDPTRLPNGVALWGAMQFKHHSWADPAGMAKLTGGVHGQIHMGKFGGSPALAFRRNRRGLFRITTRGEFDSGTTRYLQALAFDELHDLVYRLLLHETFGELIVWLNGSRIVDIARASIGSIQGGSYWAVGNYYAGGVTCPIVSEIGNHVYPGLESLESRV